MFCFTVSAILIYNNNKIQSYKEIKKIEEETEVIRESFDSVFNQTLYLSRRIFADNRFIKYCATQNPTQMDTVNIMKFFSDMTASLDAGKCITMVCFKNTNTYITLSRTGQIDEFLLEHGVERDFLNEAEDYFKSSNSYDYYVSGKTYGSYLPVAARQMFYSGNAIYYIVLFDIEYMMPFDDNSRKCYILNNGSEINGDKDGELYYNALKKKLDFQNQVSVKFKNNIAGAAFSEVFPGFLYINVNEKGGTGIFMVLMYMSVIILFAAVIFVIAIKDAKRMYDPISKTRNLFEKLSSNKNNEDDFAFIEKIASEIVDKNAELAENLHENKALFRNKLLVDMAYGNISDFAIKSTVEELGLKDGCITAIILEVSLLEDVLLNELSFSLKWQLYLRVKQLLDESGGYDIASLTEKSYLVVSDCKSATEIENTMTQLVRTIYEEFQVIVTVAIGESEEKAENLRVSFFSARYLIDYKYAMHKKSVITTRFLKTPKKINYYYPIEIENNLINAVTRGEIDKCKSIIKSIIDYNFNKLILEYNILVELKFAIVATMKRCLQLIDLSADDVFDEGSILYLEIDKCNQADSLEKKVIAMFEKIIESVGVETVDESAETARSIRDYIYEHYHEDISLTTISKSYYLSEGYISKIFKKEFGINFKTFLNMYRVDKAKEIMLENKGMKISDVALMVGCNNVTTFIRMFKLYTGTSPKNYINDITGKD